MDYNTIKSLVESGHAHSFCSYIENHLNALREKSIPPTLPAEEYKIVALGKEEAVKTLNGILAPFYDYDHVEKKKKTQTDIYHTHQPMVK